MRSRIAARRAAGPLAVAALALFPLAWAQPAAEPAGWAACAALREDAGARLACFDRWAATQRQGSDAAPGPTPGDTAARASSQPSGGGGSAPAHPVVAATVETTPAPAAALRPCMDPRSTSLSRFWELEPASDCGTLGLRGYHPLNVSWAVADGVNTAPSSPAAGHSASTPVAYQRSEMRLALSVRTKIARNLLTTSDMPGRDSLWFGYSQRSAWQLFNGAISRPFRSTDHEPELTYIHPADAPLPGGWRLRYAGLSAVHHSNGQGLPLSRSWNRVVLMAGMEKGHDFSLVARAWKRIAEHPATDDNPDISNFYGRAELAGFWNPDRSNTLGLTLRHNLRKDARGSARLEWLHVLSNEPSGLRLHTQLFTGYGDTLVDYNRRRTVFSVGLSLVDF